ncbi:hypothetical protein Poli38472_009732 [Pythium oligandrum]|uniref:VWFA domain-containing protein n=1 Tax=Pythium oligandrum TaxID=41045 RepID=A0A8K1CFT0_PYTOL|nr:hypothetical protein Poli38472_009732 [Pythium oligandrum]|eukprot:TMW62239.1 hypothetical protein Poli38472_009732 [Pythium oligandrum]
MISARCFRLLALVTEEQNEVEVAKPILQELEVMRLSCALGALSSIKAKEFESEMLDASEFDDDFARFLRHELFHGRSGGEEKRDVCVTAVFGKQEEVIKHLKGLDAWDNGMEHKLNERDQGIYAVLLPSEDDAALKKLVVFGWLLDCLFAPEHLRDMPTYILRFLTCLSSTITCCLSKEDWTRLQALVTSTESEKEWHSYSVVFRVEQQQDEEDNVQVFVDTVVSLPESIETSDLRVVKGKFPAVVQTTMGTKSKTVVPQKLCFESPLLFAQWIVSHAKKFKIDWNHSESPQEVNEAVLRTARCWPDAKIQSIVAMVSCSTATVDAECEEEARHRAECRRKAMIDAAAVVFSVDIIQSSDASNEAFKTISTCLDDLTCATFQLGLDERATAILHLPIRLRRLMAYLLALFQCGNLRQLDETLRGVMQSNFDDAVLAEKQEGRTKKMKSLVNWVWRGSQPDLASFRAYVFRSLESIKQNWLDTILSVIEAQYRYEWESLVVVKGKSYEAAGQEDIAEAINAACKDMVNGWITLCNSDLSCSVRCRMRGEQVVCEVKSEEWEPPSQRLAFWKIRSDTSLDAFGQLGSVRLEKADRVLAVYTAQASCVLVISVAERATKIHRAQLSPSSSSTLLNLKRIRRFPHEVHLCDFNVNDRIIVLIDAKGYTSLYRFNESYTALEDVRSFDLMVKSSLMMPIIRVLLTDGLLHLTDRNGAVQSVNFRNEQMSRKSANECFAQEGAAWTSELFPLIDGAALGSFAVFHDDTGAIDSGVEVISTEDKRLLKQSIHAVVPLSSAEELSVQASGDKLFVLNSSSNQLVVLSIKATIKSDSYRIRTVTGEAGDESPGTRLSSHWLWAVYHLFEKFPVRGLMEPGPLDPVRLILVGCGIDEAQVIARSFMRGVMDALVRLNKPMNGLDLLQNHCVSDGQCTIPRECSSQQVAVFLQRLVTFVPIQICRAEYNKLTVMVNGQDRSPDTSLEALQSADIARSIRFGLLSPLLQSWGSQCVVITSMGKQSTGKSYFLNHLTGSSFAIAGPRCTDGAWMCVRLLSNNVLLVVIDFEGLGSFERSEQEDVFLSVLNASISMLTVFRMEMRCDKEIDELFSKFQKGSQLVKHDAQLFRGRLYMSVKDVNPNDHCGIVHEFTTKFKRLLSMNKEKNFLSDMYAGQLEVNCSPPLGTPGYYYSLAGVKQFIENDLCGHTSSGFASGKAFLDCVRLVLAKISILDWTSMNESAVKMKSAEMACCLPDVVRFGSTGHTSLGRGALVDAVTQEVIATTLEEVWVDQPSMMLAWSAQNLEIPLDAVSDCSFDLGNLCYGGGTQRQKAASEAIQGAFTMYIGLLSRRRITVEVQKDFDVFLAFLVRRRRLNVQKWASSAFEGLVPDEWKILEQQALTPLQTMLVRCLDRCSQCQLGCMKTSVHSIAESHDCGTSHRCMGLCQYCERQDATTQPLTCHKEAGHEDKCECRSGDHTCGLPCCVQNAVNCGGCCASKAGHDGDHRCSVGMHKCGQPCLAQNCSGRCVEDAEKAHTAHKCEVDRCLQPCIMEGCHRLCDSADHFHGQTTATVAYAVEHPAKQTHTFDGASELPTIHMCGEEHECPEMCEENGICTVNVFLKSSVKTFVGARGAFQYTYQEMNGSRKKCVVKLAPGQQTHSSAHSCVVAANADQSQHYCNARCPCCSYFCQKQYGHADSHKTAHGNMRNTYFLSSDREIDVEDRKYLAGEQGTAEMCNLYCSKMGRQHVHYLACDQGSRNRCIYTGGPHDMRRHCTRPLEPEPDCEMDELLHERFWDTLGWKDPCASMLELEGFSKCGFKCDAPDHEKKPSYCVLPAWHEPESKTTIGSDGFSYVRGHKFECSHTAAGDKMHHVFVLDCSGSMSGRPWENLMRAYRKYMRNRVKEGASLDLVSVVTFDDTAMLEYEGRNITTVVNELPGYRGGMTSYDVGLRGANEVLSRVHFDSYKPVLVFFSDGNPQDFAEGKRVAECIQETYSKYGLQSFVVGFGHVQLPVLGSVAASLGGSYHHALTGEELKSAFFKISASLGATTGLALSKPIHETLCVICQKDLSSEASVALKPCGHELHHDCFRLLSANVERGVRLLCPSCRREVN